METCMICRPTVAAKPIGGTSFASSSPSSSSSSRALVIRVRLLGSHGGRLAKSLDSVSRFGGVRASMVDSYESSSNFAKRIERAWLISQQPRPVACSSCESNGHIDCKWCAGTGFFILGDNMLCQVPSRNSTCIICSGKGSMSCSDCKGTGYRAKWLGEPPRSE